jgi:hypothetical protein
LPDILHYFGGASVSTAFCILLTFLICGISYSLLTNQLIMRVTRHYLLASVLALGILAEEAPVCDLAAQGVIFPSSIMQSEGLGESPGVASLEYLGTGYDAFQGNPRGSETAELDPGFRNGVIKLEQDQAALTLDQQYLMPNGAELRYTTSCKFSSSSAELSSVDQYQGRLKSESSQSLSVSISGSYGPFSAASENHFKRSKKYESFSKDRSELKTVAFESTAVCTEFEGRLQTYHNHTLQDAFVRALKTLPELFDSEDNRAKELYFDFIEEYGTHYITQVTLGAKQIYTTEMKSQDVTRLREKSVDVSRSLSVKAMFGFNQEDTDLAEGDDDGQGSTVKNSGNNAVIINNNNGEKNPESVNTDEKKDKKSIGASASVGYKAEESLKRSSKALNEIKNKVQTVNEVNVGGIPPESGNWKEWAATARERPMPILYKYDSIANLITTKGEELGLPKDLACQFDEAVKAKYVIQESIVYQSQSPVMNAFNFGVATPTGKSISTYSNDAASNMRTAAVLKLPRKPNPSKSADDTIPPFFHYDLFWDGSATKVSAVFASFIRDNLSPNTQEDEMELGFLDDDTEASSQSIANGLYPFGLSTDPSKATIAVFDNHAVEEKQNVQLVNNFAYLTADSLPDESKFIVGVVHPQGYALNKVFGEDLGFTVSQETDRKFVVSFTNSYDEPPTFVVFPLWLPSRRDRFPENIGEVVVGTRSCTKDACKVVVGAEQSGTENDILVSQDVNRFLGFSFLAMFGPSAAEGVIHGVVSVGPGDDDKKEQKGHHYKATAVFNEKKVTYSYGSENRCYKNSTELLVDLSMFVGLQKGLDDFAEDEYKKSCTVVVQNQVVGGVLITFDPPFMDIPSVIISPLVGDEDEDDFKRNSEKSQEFDGKKEKNLETFRIPTAVVEHITEKSVFIKTGMIDTLSKGDSKYIYKPTPFHFVAVGPVKGTKESQPPATSSNCASTVKSIPTTPETGSIFPEDVLGGKGGRESKKDSKKGKKDSKRMNDAKMW